MISKNPVAERLGHFRRKFQIIARTNFRKDFKSSKEKQNSSFLAYFSPCINYIEETSHNLTKKPKLNPFEVKSVLETNCQRFCKCAITENFNIKRDPQIKNSFPIAMEIYSPTQWKEKELYLISFIFVWTCFEHHVRDMCSTQKLHFFGHRWPKTHMRHQQGHQGALIIEKLLIVTYELN